MNTYYVGFTDKQVIPRENKIDLYRAMFGQKIKITFKVLAESRYMAVKAAREELNKLEG